MLRKFSRNLSPAKIKENNKVLSQTQHSLPCRATSSFLHPGSNKTNRKPPVPELKGIRTQNNKRFWKHSKTCLNPCFYDCNLFLTVLLRKAEHTFSLPLLVFALRVKHHKVGKITINGKSLYTITQVND